MSFPFSLSGLSGGLPSLPGLSGGIPGISSSATAGPVNTGGNTFGRAGDFGDIVLGNQAPWYVWAIIGLLVVAFIILMLVK